MKKSDVKIFFKTVAVTGFILVCLTGTYLGFCRVYESMQRTIFADERRAVIIGEDYIKFFGMEFYF